MNTLLILLSSLLLSPNYKASAPKAVTLRDTIQVQAYRYGYVPYPPDSTKQKPYSDWYGSLVAEDGQIWVFDIICDSTQERGIFPTEGKEYTFKEDMIAYYTYWMQYEMGPWVPATDAKFKYWIGEDELEHMDATMKCENGKIYHITYVTKTVPESYIDRYDTLRVVRLGDYRDSVEHCFQFTATNDSITAVFAIENMTIPGTYTKDDIYGELDQFTYLYINDIDRSICDFKVTIKEGVKKGEYLIDADYYCYNGKCYHINMNYTLPTIEQIYHMNSNDMVVTMETFYDVFIQGYRVTATSEQYSLEYLLAAPGGIRANGVHMVNNETGKTIDVYADIISLYNPLHAEAEILDYDGNYYIINMTGQKPDSTETRSITIYNASLTDLTKNDGVFLLEGFTQDSTYFFSIAINNSKIEGIYTQDDAVYDYTYMADYVVDSVYGSYMSNGYYMVALDAEITQINDQYVVKAKFLSQCLAETVITPLFTIYMTTSPQSTNLLDSHSETQKATYKFLRDGHIFIDKQGTRYTILGSLLNNY